MSQEKKIQSTDGESQDSEGMVLRKRRNLKPYNRSDYSCKKLKFASGKKRKKRRRKFWKKSKKRIRKKMKFI